MHTCVHRLASRTLTVAAVISAVACGVEGPGPKEVGALTDAAGGAAGSAQGGGGGATSSSSGTTSSSSNSSSSSSSSSSASSGGGSMGGGCSIMSSNEVCATCLETWCCEVLNECMDEDFLGCVSCLDCFLEGQGAACCDQNVGKNDWLVECVAYNCEDEC